MTRPASAAASGSVLALLLGACAVGPRYHAPTTPAAGQGAFINAAGAEAVADPLPPHWWRLYQDPVLDSLVEQALVHNEDLKVAAANLAYAQGLLSEARAGQFPTTELDASGPGYARQVAKVYGGGPPGTNYTLGFTAAYQVDLFGRVRRTIQAARANAEEVQAAEDVTRVTVAGQTAGAYANICGYGEQLAVARRSVELVKETYDLTVAQRDAGALSDFDVAREGVILAQAQAVIPPLEGQRRAALYTLAVLIGKTPSEVPPEAAACQTPPKIGTPLPVGDGAALLRRRPDLREAERGLAAATARIGVAAADLYPTITLGGSFSNFGPTAGSLGSNAGVTYSVAPALNWTMPNILVARAHVREAGAQASAALAGFDGAVLKALGDSETALAAYSAELGHHLALAQAKKTADEALRLANVQFQAGAASFLDLITAEQTAVAADQAVALSDQTISSDQVAVFQALGGGWEGAPAVTPPRLSGR